MAETIRVGVIGCGEIAQIMHLPFLEQLDAFQTVALCDISRSLVEALGSSYGVKQRFTAYRDLLDCNQVDAVVVCTYDHAEIVRQAIEAGKHVLCEKPLGFTVEEIADLPQLASEKGLVGMVGYMRLFDPGYEYGQERIANLEGLTSVQVHDLAGPFNHYQELYRLVRASDVPTKVMAEERAEVAVRMTMTLGSAHAHLANLYAMLLMLASHDLAVTRALLGGGPRVEFARAVGSSQVLAILEYPGRVPVVFHAGVGTSYEWWDQWVAAYGARSEVRVEFGHPYVRYAPTVVRVREPLGTAPSEVVSPVSHDSPFRRELEHFAACVRDGTTPRSDFYGAVADVALAREIILSLPTSPGTSVSV